MNAEPPLAGPVTAYPRAGSSKTRLIVCEEYGSVNLPVAELVDPSGRLLLNPEIESAGYFTMVLSKGTLTLRARGHVGFIPLNGESVVYVRPRVPIANLTRMVEIAGENPIALSLIRTYATGKQWSHHVHTDLYATALSRYVKEIMLAGFLREYRRRDEVSSFPRGRILVHRTTQSLVHRGIRHAACSTWFERTVDNASNRCLKYAMFLLAEYYLKSPPAISAARHQYREMVGLYHAFGDVALDHSRCFLEDPFVRGQRALPPTRAYYRDALNIACAIIEGRALSLDSPEGRLRLPSVVIDTARLFESYVRTILTLHAVEQGWRVDVLDGNREGARPLFADGIESTATPDIIIRAGAGATPLVLDVKDTPTGSYQRDAVEQVVTYALCYGSTNALLVHPCARGQSSGLRALGTIGDIAVHVYRFDLGACAGTEEDRRFGGAVATLLPSSVLPADAVG